jgi:hypothetical protein
MPDSDLTTALRAIRSELEVSGATYADESRLLAAVEAVLKVREPEAHYCYMGEQQCGHDGAFWPCPTVLAITSKLLGEGESEKG